MPAMPATAKSQADVSLKCLKSEGMPHRRRVYGHEALPDQAATKTGQRAWCDRQRRAGVRSLTEIEKQWLSSRRWVGKTDHFHASIGVHHGLRRATSRDRAIGERAARRDGDERIRKRLYIGLRR